MPVQIYFRADHCLRVNKFFGAVGPAHFRKLADFYTERRELLAHDLISLVDEAVEVSGFTPDALGELRQIYRELRSTPTS